MFTDLKMLQKVKLYSYSCKFFAKEGLFAGERTVCTSAFHQHVNSV